MARWKAKGCPRCGGDMFLDRDLDFWYEQCLQCSYRVELKPLERVKAAAFAGDRRAKKPVEAEETEAA